MHNLIQAIHSPRVQPTFLDPRTALVLEPLRWIRQHAYDWVVLEQVPDVLPIWEAYASTLRSLGFHAATRLVKCEQYGLPQSRRRAFLLASKRPFVWPEPTHSEFHPWSPQKIDPGMPRWVTMGEALQWSGPFILVSNYGSGGDPKNHAERNQDQPSTTITTKGNRMKVRPDRTLTVDDVAVLQGFPRGYPWQGPRNAQFEQIGNAVPPGVAQIHIKAVAFPEH